MSNFKKYLDNKYVSIKHLAREHDPWAQILHIVDSFFLKKLSYLLFFFNLLIYFYFWLCWVFVSVRGLSLVATSRGHSSSRCEDLWLSRPLLLRSTGSRRAGSVVVAHGPGCSAACGIFPDQGLNPCPLHWQADSQPLHHQGSPMFMPLAVVWVMKSFVLIWRKKNYNYVWWQMFTRFIVVIISQHIQISNQYVVDLKLI